LLGPINREIVTKAKDALQKGDAEKLGKLMTEAQTHFDKYATLACPEELTAPVLHKLLNYEKLKVHSYGAKGVGSQGDGTAQLLARSEKDQNELVKIIEADLKMKCLKFTIKPSFKVRKAVITAAGFGTRMFPATKATRKELFPVIDENGIAKPAILFIVEEALNSGIEEIYIIIQEEDKELFKSFFNVQVSVENYNKLPAHFQEYSKKLLEIGKHVKLITQKSQEGFGHAVYCTYSSIGNEPFLLMLGDHLYRSASKDKSCTQQLLDVYEEHALSVVGLSINNESVIASVGTVTGTWIEPKKLLNISEFAEKPTLDYARNNLRVAELSNDQYLTIFGLYILHPYIFNILEENINNNFRERGEFQLTSALDRLRKEQGCFGRIIDGKRYDIGLPHYYLETLKTFSEKL